MEKNTKIKIGDLVYIADKNGMKPEKKYVDKARTKNRQVKVMNFETLPYNGDTAKVKALYEVLHIDEEEELAFIKKKNGKYLIYSLDSIKKVPKCGDKVIYKMYKDGDGYAIGIVKVLDYPAGSLEVGGTIDLRLSNIGVEFLEEQKEFHDLGGLCAPHRGWYCSLDYIEVITENEVQDKKIDENSEEIKELKNKLDALIKENVKLVETIKKKDRIQDLLNEAVIEKAKDIAVEDVENHLKNNLDKFIEDKYGVLPKRIEIVRDETTRKTMTGIFHKEFENICRIVNSDIPLMLVGSAGAGKNYTLEQVAEALDLEFYFSNAVNQEYKLTGFIDANGKYHETQFYQAFTKGGMFFLDEIDASCPECLVILNSAIANRYFDFPIGRVKAHENFRVVCAGNTYGTGADMVYVGRNVLDGATLDRFVVLPFDYDDEVEKQLAYDQTLYDFIRALRNAITESNLRYIVSMRALINATKLLKIGVDKMSILKTTIIKNMQIDDLNTIVSKVSKTHFSEWTDCLKRMCDNVRN